MWRIFLHETGVIKVDTVSPMASRNPLSSSDKEDRADSTFVLSAFSLFAFDRLSSIYSFNNGICSSIKNLRSPFVL